MGHKPIATKAKIIFGYFVLLGSACLAVWFVYTEILQTSILENPGTSENSKIIKISDAIADLYAAEATGREALLEGSDAKLSVYKSQIDSVIADFKGLHGSDENQNQKLDSLEMLLGTKQRSMTDLLDFRKKHKENSSFNRAVGQLNRVKDSLNGTVKPVVIDNDTQLKKFLNSVLTKKQQDSLSRLPVSNEQLTAEIEKMLNRMILRDDRLRYSLYLKEQKLQDESRVLSDQIRTVISSLQQEIIQESYAKVERSKERVESTTDKIAWVGAAAFLIFVAVLWMVIRDITVSQRYRQLLEKLNSEKEDLLRSKTMLMATVTHDIQTPLGSVIGFADLMRNTALTSRQAQYVENIRSSSDYIVRLVNDLVDFSKLESDRIRIETVPFNFKDLVEGVCLSLLPNASAKGIELRWIVDPDLDGGFVSDPYRLRQILTNLVSNAVKFTQKGFVEIRAESVGGKISVSVKDTGIGIAKSSQKAVFKEFTQAHSGIEKKFGGTGLGLTIAKRMLRLLGGGIGLESEEGKGSTFTITIPKVPASLGTESTSEQHDLTPLQGKRLLIVDDDMTQLALMSEIFGNYPVEVRTENHASKVPELLSEEYFDLVITDIQMPDVDGFELVRRLREHQDPAVSQIPVVALSGKRDLTTDDFISKGFTDVHVKPLHLSHLLSQLADILAQRTTIRLPRDFAVSEDTGKMYNLETLNQFTQEDKDSLRIILNTFMASSRENCRELSEALKEQDRNRISALAHKMSPMLKQLEAWQIVRLIEPLEFQSNTMDYEQIRESISRVCSKMEELFGALETELS